MKLLIGYGNTLRRDDGVGWQIASQLAPELDPEQVHIIQVHQLMPEIAANIAESDAVIFVDASIEGEPGSLRVLDLSPSASLPEAHALGPADLLTVSQNLYERRPPAYLLTITGQDFELGEGLSDLVQAAIPEALERIRSLL